MVEGRIQTRSWDDKDGKKNYRTEIVADRVQFGPRSGTTAPAGAASGSNDPQSNSPANAKEVETIEYPDDDINAMLSFRNLAKVRVIAASEANTYDLVDNTAVLFAKPALTWLEGVLS